MAATATRRMAVIRLIVLSVVSAALLSACGGSNSSHSSGSGSGRKSTTSAVKAASATSLKRPVAPTHTSCRSVEYIGDSTSDGEASAEYVPEAKLRAPAQLSKVGVKKTHMDVSGARSIYEIYNGIPNAAMVARREVRDGYHGCWILALGTNEAADVAAGSTFGLKTRIARMMSIIGNQPVMWVNSITLPGTPQYYGESGMREWDNDLVAACPKYPTMRVFDWAAHAKPSWFIPDHIHYTPQGYIQRTRAIVHGLVKAFPASQPSSPASSPIARTFVEAFSSNGPPNTHCLVK
ncbi:MAG TPA: SGNH/GDSL hydrolase family protein [Solirubrobacteraceae bacterium]|nr:SGNH/GDSL hydrolase family protein [Solirubrobacteraceae bacterium]